MTVTITITITKMNVSPGPSVDTYAEHWYHAGWRLHCEHWVADLLFLSFACLSFLQNLRLQFSTPWPWGIMRSCCNSSTEDKVQTTISTDVMILANTLCLLHATPHLLYAGHHPPYITSLTPPGASNWASLWNTNAGAYMGAIVEWDWKRLPSWECTWECRAK